MLQSCKTTLTRDFFTLTIPVKAYVRKYIESRYPAPIEISLNNYLGTVIFSYITKTCQTIKSSDQQIEVRYRLLTDFIKIHIPRQQVNKHNIGLSIPFEKAVLLNNLFENKIGEDLHTYCMAARKCGKPQRQAIEDFCEDHNIDIGVDIGYDAFRKAEYRHKIKINKSTPNLSPSHFASTG